MKFVEINSEQRKIQLDFLGFDPNKMKCHYCGDRTTYDKCSIMPFLKKGSRKKHTTILCNSILCMTEYITILKVKKQGR